MRPKTQEVRVGKTRGPKTKQNKAPPHTACPHPQPAKPFAAASGAWEGLGNTTITISSRNVRLQLKGAQHLGPSSASPARGLRSRHRGLTGSSRGRKALLWTHSPNLCCKASPLFHNIQKWLGSPRRWGRALGLEYCTSYARGSPLFPSSNSTLKSPRLVPFLA